MVTDSMIDKIRGRTAKIGVVTLNQHSLPLALRFSDASFPVILFDEAQRVKGLKFGDSPFPYLSNEKLVVAQAVDELSFDSNWERIADCEIVILCTEGIRGQQAPDFSNIISDVRNICPRLTSGALLILENNAYPGVSSRLISEFRSAGLEQGQNFHLACSWTKAIDTPNDFEYPPRIYAGIDKASADLCWELYSSISHQLIQASSLLAAETSLACSEAIALVNNAFAAEVTALCQAQGLDPWEVLSQAAAPAELDISLCPQAGFLSTGQTAAHFLTRLCPENGSTRLLSSALDIVDALPRRLADQVASAIRAKGKPLLESVVVFLYGDDRAAELPGVKALRQILEGMGMKVRHIIVRPLKPTAITLFGADVAILVGQGINYRDYVTKDTLIFDLTGTYPECRLPA